MAPRKLRSNKCSINLGPIKFTSAVIEDTELNLNELINSIRSRDPKRKESLNLKVIRIIERNDYKTFKHLLENGYRLQVLNNQGQTALHLAFYKNSQSIIFTLLKIDEFCKLIDNEYTDCNGLTHLHIACAKGQTQLVKKLLEYTQDINAHFYTDPDGILSGFTPLHFALMNWTEQRVQIVKLLITRGADVHAADTLGRTALHLACRIFDPTYPTREMSLEVMQLLVKHKSNVNAKDAKNNTPLLSIFPKNYTEFKIHDLQEYQESKFLEETTKKLQFLLKHGADVTVSNNDGDDVLHLILSHLRRSRYTPSDFLRNCFSLFEYVDINFIEFSYFDIHYETMIRAVLQRNKKFNINTGSHCSQTYLKLAVACMNVKIVEMLIRCGADIKSLKFDEKNFFYYLGLVPNYDVVKNLLNLLEVLKVNGFNITLEDNLQVLKFLIHRHTPCQCNNLDYDFMQMDISNLLYVGSPKHVKHVLKKICDDWKLKKNNFGSSVPFPILVLGKLKTCLDIAKAAKIYQNEEVKDLLWKIITDKVSPCEFNMWFGDDRHAHQEAPGIEAIVLTENLKLTDILMMDPNDVPYHIVNDYFHRELVHEFWFCSNAIKGHMAKIIVRYYTLKSAEDYFKVLLRFSLPRLLCRKIMNFLSNEEILDMCVAAMLTDP